MAPSPLEHIVLLSIHPEYAEAILDGSKRVEFRKAALRPDVRAALVYATTPVQRLVGVFRIARIDTAPPSELWERYHQVGGLTADAFEAYYCSWRTGAAILIAEAWRLQHPVPLAALGDEIRPPQSYRYLEARLVDALLQEATTESPPVETSAPLTA